MKWTVIDTIACPNTGVVFSSIMSLKMFRIVIWYEGDVIFPPGATIEPYRDGMAVDGKYTPLKMFNTTAFNSSAWQTMKDKIKCPESAGNDPDHCFTPFRCALKVCPYGKKHTAASRQ